MKRIKMDDIDLEMTYGKTMYVAIDTIKFVKEEDYNWVEIFILDGGQYGYFDEIENSQVDTIEDLRKVAVKWLFDNVTIGDKEV